ncbi:hypothetical protein H8S95_05065 [Pontibacter sp. KCTC 32443]|uniref:hypothetical protein n=1 Tax=Pontibacter TaxID=323449 RepID=UPI00164EC425|nr:MULTISPECIES: hypothetical protein [Pontibacter]MBC5773426.1 hypothetical protein [Pontibacter sp. KCTC 32443]
MAGLQAEELSNEFFKSFLPETVFLVDGDVPVPVISTPESIEPELAQVVKPLIPAETTKNTIPAVPKFPKIEAPAKSVMFNVIGENQKGVAVLVTIPDTEFRKLPQLEFLNKILQAIGLQPADVVYVNNVSGSIAVFEELQHALQVNYILSFASRVESNLPHDKFTLYNPVMLGSVPIVFSHALADLENDVEKKKLLWGALQKVFRA